MVGHLRGSSPPSVPYKSTILPPPLFVLLTLSLACAAHRGFAGSDLRRRSERAGRDRGGQVFYPSDFSQLKEGAPNLLLAALAHQPILTHS